METTRVPRRAIRLAVIAIVTIASVTTAVPIVASVSSGVGQASAEASAKAADTNSYAVVVNKRRPLPAGFVPKDLTAVHVAHVGKSPLLRKKAATAVESLFTAFTAETGLQMRSNSAYRSFTAQKATYAAFLNSVGESEAAETTAKPGYSEHQTGLAIDIGAVDSGCDARACFADTTQSRWLAKNAWRFGFIIRYPRGQEAVTGYSYEPWHIRYVGRTLAKKIHGHYSSLEAYFDLGAAPTY